MCTFVFNYNDKACKNLFYFIINLIGFIGNSLVASMLQPGLFLWCTIIIIIIIIILITAE